MGGCDTCIRDWKALILYRPDGNAQYRQIDQALFTATIDWRLIEQPWQELIPVARSIHSGTSYGIYTLII
ncbi:Tn3 family transposase [Paraburkholderia hospita]|uniref:Tn3 family transposase n=1 Tax=Paraburkholderia hospita TaxID=169430 RepID=UPI0009DA2202|nr:hypothetical protein CA602_15025 [Paraburkholderia hospita]